MAKISPPHLKTRSSPQRKKNKERSFEKWWSELSFHLAYLRANQLPNGLWVAAPGETPTGRKFVTNEEYSTSIWFRDNVFIINVFLEIEDYETAKKGITGLFAILKKHTRRLDQIIKNPSLAFGSKSDNHRLCPRYDFENLKEKRTGWSNAQNDNLGELLWLFGQAQKKGLNFLDGKENAGNRKICQKLIDYLKAIRFWQDQDVGFWEEEPREARASSIGACVAGLKSISPYLATPKSLISKGEKALKELLPRETKTRPYDAALLYLISPFCVVKREMAEKILKQTEKYLFQRGGRKGCLRYLGDEYNAIEGQHAFWAMFIPQAAKGHLMLRQTHQARKLLKIVRGLKVEGRFPEAQRGEMPLNGPLFWAEAAYAGAVHLFLSILDPHRHDNM